MRDHEDFCNEIFKIDKKIRYVGIIDENRTYQKMREGLQCFLTTEETRESMNDAILRWETRKKLSKKTGQPIYAMAVYEKVKRITIPLDNNGLILVSMDPSGYHEVILKEIINIKNEFL